MKWGAKNQYQVPGDMDTIDKATVALLTFVFVLLWLIVLVGLPGPH